jgi:hypothetical protein
MAAQVAGFESFPFSLQQWVRARFFMAVLDGNDVIGTRSDKLHAFSGKITYCALLRGQNGACGQNAQHRFHHRCA